QLLRDQHGQHGLDALAELGILGHDGHRAVRRHANVVVRIGRCLRRPAAALREKLASGFEAQHHSATGQRADFQKGSAYHLLFLRAHNYSSLRAAAPLLVEPLPARPAALWMACRMRRYVPQRHRFPFIAESISLSVGFGVLASSAAADMICPAWQYPHCGTSISCQANWHGWVPSGDRPSSVVTGLAPTAETGVRQARNANPPTCTVQAPHWPIPQPYLAPRRSSISRKTHSSGISAGAS